MRSCLLPTLFALTLAGCIAQVRLELPPSPAVALHTDTVAVVAHDRSCQMAADAVALELTKSSYLVVDPRSSLRVELLGCAADQTLDNVACR